jgi:hypothetical protein
MSGVARLAPSSQSGGVPSKLSRPECGTVAGIGDPAGCEVSRGSPAGKRAHLGSAPAEKLLTEEPSCEAEDMTAREAFAKLHQTLDDGAPSRHVLQDRPHERAESTTKRSSARGVRCAKAVLFQDLSQRVPEV